MRKGLVAALLFALFAGTGTSGAVAQTPLTLEVVLRAVTPPPGADSSTPGLAAAALVRPGFVPSLLTGTSVAPDVGVPAKYVLSQQLSFDVGSRAGRLGRARSTQAAAAQVVALLATSRRSAAQNAVSAFFAVATDQAQFASATQNVELARRTLVATTQRGRVGVAPRVDADRARAALRSSEADLAAATAALEADRAALGALLTTSPVRDVSLPNVGTVPAADVVRDRALQRNSLVASADAELRSAEALLLVVQAEAAPGLSAGAGAALTRDAAQKTVGPLVSATLTLPISTNAARAARGAAEARVAAGGGGVQQTRQNVVQSALRLRAQAVSAAARIALLRDAVTNAQRVAESTLAGYRLGAVSSADLITAQTQFVAARAALDSATVQASQTFATLQIEIGDLPS